MDRKKLRGFTSALSLADCAAMVEFGRKARKDVLEMTTRAHSGHLGGALSSIDIFTVLWTCANVSPETAEDPDRDRIVVSHGHTAAAVYAVLGNLGYIPIAEAIRSFRKAGSIFEGHPHCGLRGVEWCNGSLGQGLSVACGLAIASRVTGQSYRVYVIMGDGEQQKGQIMEAAEFASKYQLGNLVAVVDANGLQASGRVEDIMPQNISARYRAAGWRVLEVDGHSFKELHAAFRSSRSDVKVPTVVIARTTMGSGISFIEDRFEYHGMVLKESQLREALDELGFSREAAVVGHAGSYRDDRRKSSAKEPVECRIRAGIPRIYPAGEFHDCRSAFGAALLDVIAENARGTENTSSPPIAVFDCDLAASVRTEAVRTSFPDCFFECGIQENNAASVAAALSSAGVLTFFAEFGVFGIDETYGQHRMNDLNPTSLKVVLTHCGLDVGEDGKSHQCIDYVSLPANLFSHGLIIPADANQTDRVIRFVSTTPGSFFVAMGRSKVPVLTDSEGKPYFGDGYRFAYGRADWLREGGDAVIVTCGTMVHRAIAAHDVLHGRGVRVGVLNLSCPLALDEPALRRAANTGLIVSYEDHNARTGIGSLVAAFLIEHDLRPRLRRLGVTRLGSSGESEDLYRLQSLDTDSLVQTLAEELSFKTSHRGGAY